MTIWFDFTTTIRSEGRSGIGNVESTIGRSLMSSVDGVVAFAVIDGIAVEIDAEAELARTPYGDAPVPLRSTPSPGERIRAKLVQDLGVLAPPTIRALAAVNGLRRRVVASTRRVVGRRHGEPRRPIEHRIAAGDVVISIGAVWSGEVTRVLSSLKHARGCSIVMMAYDLIPLTHTHLAFNKETAIFERYYAGLIATADLITCISRQSERDLRDFALRHGLRLPTTEVLRLGDGHHRVPHGDRSARDGFFLCVGTVERRKNHEVIYDALRIMESEGDELPTVLLVGGAGWGTDDLLAELELQSTAAARAIVVLGALDDDAIDSLYRRARALLFPSYYEGWGLPVREAAIRGCPIAAGDSPAVREAGDGVPEIRFLDPDDPAAWADYLRDPGEPYEAVAAFTWDDAASQLLDHIASNVGTSNRTGVTDGHR